MTRSATASRRAARGGRPGEPAIPRAGQKSAARVCCHGASILSEPVTAKAPNGGVVRLDGLGATYLALCRKALKGDDASLFQAINLMLDVMPAGEEKRSKRDAEYSDAKRKFWVMIGLPEEECPEC